MNTLIQELIGEIGKVVILKETPKAMLAVELSKKYISKAKHEKELKRAVIKAYESGFNLGGEITYKTIKSNVIPHNEYVSSEQYYKANHAPKERNPYPYDDINNLDSLET